MSELLQLAQAQIEKSLPEVLERIQTAQKSDGPETGHQMPEILAEAMSYAVLTPGKRLRPALVFGGAKAVGGKTEDALPAACAVEMVHAYSLVHDDLPALDNDDLRRGKPSCHKAFGEATAVLTGDALLTEAIGLVVDARPLGKGNNVTPARRAQAALELTRAIGAAGMVGGQQDDLAYQDQKLTADTLRTIHRRKTGRLIQASIVLGAIFGGGNVKQIASLRAFGAEIGLAFQLVDDILDQDGVAEAQGDAATREEAQRCTQEALDHLTLFGRRAQGLRQIARLMAERTK